MLPEGVMLPAESWAPRHRWIVRLLWLHVPALALFSLVKGHGLAHSVLEVLPITAIAIAAASERFGQRTRSCLAGAGLMTASAVLVHLGEGRIEMHFHFFVMLPVISLYQEWRPFLLSIGFVAVHHGSVGILSPLSVFDHEAAWDAPLQWAGIHAAFVLAASTVCVLSWRLIEDTNRAARRELEANERRFRAIIEHSNDVVTVIDADGVIVYDSPSVERVLGYSSTERLGADALELVHPEDVAHASQILGQIVADGGTVKDIEVRVRHHDGSYIWVEASVTNLLDEPGLRGLVANFRDVNERHVLENALAHQAFHDALTGLANRALLLDRVEHAIRAAHGRNASRVALLFLDLDDFKTVNDGLGHAAGDAILRATADRIADAVRAGDTAARLGGDEFAVLLPGISDPALAYEIGARLLEAVCTPIELDGVLVAVNGSLGIVVSDGTEDAAALLRNADLAMYRAKSAGKGRFEVYEAGMHAMVVERMSLKADLRQAVERGEIEPHYQPIVDLDTGEVVGVEALARWNHPTRGMVPPNEFIPLAEETGLIVPLGLDLLRRACSDTARWGVELGDRAPKSVSVNLSAHQVQHPGLVADVRTALQESGLSPASLTLEITESVLLEDADAAGATLGALKALGVRIALDDFGTGYSSLSYLHQFPVDVVKIDKSFIDSLNDRSSRPSPLVGAIVNLGTLLGLGVTAEGIEDARQLSKLRSIGCQHGQGYYFARPIAAADLPGILGAVPAVEGARHDS